MLRLCGNRNPRVVLGDLENLPLLDVKFDGVWAVTSLLHMPKAELPNVLENINGLLRTGGMFYISMKEGNFEGFVDSDKYPGKKRFFSLYTDNELRDYLRNSFEIVNHSWDHYGNATFLNYLCSV